MVDLTRRKTVIGLGLLATGSGATFTSAAFNNEVNPDSDIRVVAQDQLIVEPGDLFRDDEGVDPDDADPSDVGSGDVTLKNETDDPLFDGDNDDGDDLESIGTDDLPAASVNNETNGDLNLEVALPLADSGTIDDLIQVRNDGQEDRDVAIRYESGSDVSDGDEDDELAEDNLDDILKFTTGEIQISPSDATADPQEVYDTQTVDAGTAIQVSLKYDTNGAEDLLRDAGTPNAGEDEPDPFNQSTDTIDLLDSIFVGTEDGEDVNN